MNYDETRQGALMRVAEMAKDFNSCGIRLRDDYTLDDALEFSGMRLLEIVDDGYEGMLAVFGSRSHTGRRVSNQIMFIPRTTAITVGNLRKLIGDLSVMADCNPSITNITIKYTIENFHRRNKNLNNNNVTADVGFDMPDAPVEWRIPSDSSVDPAKVPNLNKAKYGDTVVISPSADFQVRVSSVMLLSLLSECFMRAGADKKLYFFEGGDGSYVIAAKSSDLFNIKQTLQLDFFPVPDPDYDDELYEREADAATASEMDDLTRTTADIKLGEAAVDGEFFDDLNQWLDDDTDDLPEIAAMPVVDDAEISDDDESSRLDPELVEQLSVDPSGDPFDINELAQRARDAALHITFSPKRRRQMREIEYAQVRDQLVQLAQRGLRMNSGFILRDVMRNEGIRPSRLRRRGWEGLMWFLCGVDKINGEIKPYSDDIMVYDYRDWQSDALLPELTRQIQRMTRGELHFGSMLQHSDYRGRPESFEFVQGGKKQRWDFKSYRQDARMLQYFTNMAELMRTNGCAGNLWYLECRGHCYYMYVTQKNGLRLRRLTNLPLQSVLDLNETSIAQ